MGTETGGRTIGLVNLQQQIEKGNEAIEQIITEAKARGIRINADYDERAYRRVNKFSINCNQVSHLSHEE